MHTARPCPWCLEDQVEITTERSISGWFAQAQCAECSARGPSRHDRDPEKAERDALDEWNDGWEPSEAQQGLIPIPDGYAEN